MLSKNAFCHVERSCSFSGFSLLFRKKIKFVLLIDRWAADARMQGGVCVYAER